MAFFRRLMWAETAQLLRSYQTQHQMPYQRSIFACLVGESEARCRFIAPGQSWVYQTAFTQHLSSVTFYLA